MALTQTDNSLIQGSVIIFLAVVLIVGFYFAHRRSATIIGLIISIIALLFAAEVLILLFNIKNNLNPIVYTVYIISTGVAIVASILAVLSFGIKFANSRRGSASVVTPFTPEPVLAPAPAPVFEEPLYNAEKPLVGGRRKWRK